MPFRRIIIVFILLAMIAPQAPAQEYVSDELNQFLTFVQKNHLNRMSTQEYNRLHPGDWSWILGAAFRAEWQRTSQINDRGQRQQRLDYLDRIWEELLDYVTQASSRYSSPGISGQNLRAELIDGFNYVDKPGHRMSFLNTLQINSNRLNQSMYYANGLPTGGRMNHPEGYYKPYVGNSLPDPNRSYAPRGRVDNQNQPSNRPSNRSSNKPSSKPWKPGNKTWVPNIPIKR